MSAVVDRVVAMVRSDPGAPLPERRRIQALVRAADPLAPPSRVAELVAMVHARLDGLGPLQPFLDDDAVTDVLVNGPGPVWVERAGQLEPTSLVLDRSEVEHLVERIVAPAGKRADPVHALVDARLPDGSRAHIAMPPLAVDGPIITIRRFSVRALPLDAFASAAVVRLLVDLVRGRCNVVISGATGSGKTTLLNALAGEVAPGERIVTVEDAAELRLGAPHVVRLEGRPPSADGGAGVGTRELVRNALRMRPDRIVVGEVRGGECLDLIAAMSTGHDGSLSTVHANSAGDAVARLEALALLGGTALPHHAVRHLLAAAVDVVVHVARRPGGVRVVEEVVEVAVPSSDGSLPAPRPLVRGGQVVGEPTRLRHHGSAP